MKKYHFRKISDDGIIWDFDKKFPDAFKADRWAAKCFHLWFQDKITYRVIFLA